MRRNRLALVIAFVFIDLLGYSLFLPLLPYYAETLGATPTLVGLLIASNALAQLAAAPIVGRLSDRLGRRPLLIFSIFGTLAFPLSTVDGLLKVVSIYLMQISRPNAPSQWLHRVCLPAGRQPKVSPRHLKIRRAPP